MMPLNAIEDEVLLAREKDKLQGFELFSGKMHIEP